MRAFRLVDGPCRGVAELPTGGCDRHARYRLSRVRTVSRCADHGLDDCLTCALTRYAELRLRALLLAIFTVRPPSRPPVEARTYRPPSRPRFIA